MIIPNIDDYIDKLSYIDDYRCTYPHQYRTQVVIAFGFFVALLGSASSVAKGTQNMMKIDDFPMKVADFPEERGIPWISGFSHENMMFSRIFRGIWWEIFWGEDFMGTNGIANMIWGISWWMFETFYVARFGSMFDLNGAQREGHLCASQSDVRKIKKQHIHHHRIIGNAW